MQDVLHVEDLAGPSHLRHPANRHPGRPTRRLLVAIAKGLSDAVSVVDRPIAPPGGRAFTRLLGTTSYEAWLIAWSPGAQLDLHDHGGAAAAVTVVEGALTEMLVDRTNGSVTTRSLVPTTTVTIGADQAHQVRNDGATDTVSVHVYSPVLENMTFFDTARPGALRATRTERYEVAP